MIKRLLTPLVGVLLISGCTTVADPAAPPVLSGSIKDEKAMYAAEAAFFGVQMSVDSAVNAGLLEPGSEKAVKVADMLTSSKMLLDQARLAHSAGNTQQMIQLSFTVLQIVAEIQEQLSGGVKK